MIHEYMILLPIAYNDGTPITNEAMSTVLGMALSMCGGYRISNETCTGAWYNTEDKHTYYDVCRELTIATDNEQNAHTIACAVAIACKQHSVYLRTPSGIHFVEQPSTPSLPVDAWAVSA